MEEEDKKRSKSATHELQVTEAKRNIKEELNYKRLWNDENSDMV